MNKSVTIYLAGAIRDTHIMEDSQWREDIISDFKDLYPEVRVLNPLSGKVFNGQTKEWTLAGKRLITKSRGIVAQDLWSVRQADVIIANFTSMVSGYPSIGTVMEVGAAAIQNKLIYSIIDPTFSGHGNPGAFKGLHPFLQEVSAEIFATVAECREFLVSHMGMLTGRYPAFGGVYND